MHVLDILKERGFIKQVTFEEDLYKKFENETVTFYVGVDPTADSMHIGHCIPIYAMAHLQRAGHNPIALMGGGTAMVGDPSGRTDLRKMLAREDIAANVAKIQRQLGLFLDFEGEHAAKVENNADWLLDLNYVDFLRDIGAHFSVNRMLTAECYKSRMEQGLTFLEFNYMLMQSYDFLVLYQKHGCSLQIGGDDQWSNILAGADLIRRKERGEAFALTFNLLLTHDGVKMGKTQKGALWLDPEKCSPYDFYQYWRNIDDQDVKTCLSLLTFLPMDEVNRLSSLPGEQINEAKKALAFEVTRQIHGEEAAKKAEETAASLFGGGGDIAPTTEIPSDMLEGLTLATLMQHIGLVKSSGELRRLIAQGGVSVNDEKAIDAYLPITREMLEGEGILIRKGKKIYHRAKL